MYACLYIYICFNTTVRWVELRENIHEHSSLQLWYVLYTCLFVCVNFANIYYLVLLFNLLMTPLLDYANYKLKLQVNRMFGNCQWCNMVILVHVKYCNWWVVLMNVRRTHVMHTFVSVVVFSTVDFLLFVTAPCLRICSQMCCCLMLIINKLIFILHLFLVVC